jgi:hypothetical protein
MLYMTGTNGLKIVILESANLEELKKGRPAKTPDGKVLIGWTPDPGWLAEQIKNSSGDGSVIGRLIDEAAQRPEQPIRPSFPTEEVDFKKGK